MSFRPSPEEVAEWIAAGEGRRVEFKRGLPRPERTARVLAAFGNTNGGVLLVGVTDRGEVQGVGRPAEVLERLASIASTSVVPALEVALADVEVGGRTLVVASVPLSPDRPHAVTKRDGSQEVVVRVGSSNRVADGATRRALGAPRSGGSLSELERRVLAFVGEAGSGGDRPNAGATVAGFAQAHNVGTQRARRAFVRLEQLGRIVGHGSGSRRLYGLR